MKISALPGVAYGAAAGQRRARSRLKWTASCLALLGFLLPTGLRTQTSEERVLYKHGFLKVVTPDDVTESQARQAAQKVKAAWDFDLEVMHWAEPEEMARPLTLRLVGKERLKREFPGVRAYAKRDVFTVGADLLDDPSLVRTFAQELGHVQAFRARRNLDNPVRTYFMEGHGLMLNWLYSDRLGMDRRAAGAGQVRGIMSIGADEAQTILADEKYSKVGTPEEKAKKNNRMEVIGLFFIEYVRARKGVPDAVPRMARVFELVGDGESYGNAFEKVYGFTASRVAAEIGALFRQTEGNAAARFKGTRFEEYLPTAKATK